MNLKFMCGYKFGHICTKKKKINCIQNKFIPKCTRTQIVPKEDYLPVIRKKIKNFVRKIKLVYQSKFS